ncbi:MAG: glycosyltransferase [Dehalococcoidia bacterium]|jgi:cellulose synthase/poly-beta-1,6-N-acetylglucosamine synthase-like glycosyltransferase
MVILEKDRLSIEPPERSDGNSRRIGDILLDAGYISPIQLNRALQYQQQFGGRLGWILATLGYINRLDLSRALASHFHLPCATDVSYMVNNINKDLAALVTPEEVARYQAIPFRKPNGTLDVLTSEPENPETLAFLQRRFGHEIISQIVVSDLDIMKLTDAVYRDTMLDKSVHGLFYRNPDESAQKVFNKSQISILCLLLLTTFIAIAVNAQVVFIIFLFAVQFFYLISFLYKFIVTAWGLKRTQHRQYTEDNYLYLDPKRLPVYTVLIAAYKEMKVIPTLIKAVQRLDYPADKLDIILLLEENDKETLEATKKAHPPVSWRILTLPNSEPKTKPKALNYGIQFARGEYLTIYDAEDIPEPDQLKKAVVAFRTHPDDYICFQASLNYFNRNENFLTKMFTLEYTYWFDCLLPGLDAMGLPIPLGGTSNHFHVQKLKKIGAWDPFNVTEDADLGIRAAAKGYKVGIIKSTTYEEANSKLGNWLRQRSRWVKGYMQTFLIHNRHPLQGMKVMGLKKWLGYNLLIGGTPALFLLNPIMWCLFIYFLTIGAPILSPHSTPIVLFYVSAINLFVGNAVVICLNLFAVVPRKYYHLIPYALLSPVYWLLQSVGAYKALWQLIVKPSYWEKTEHGITNFVITL